MSDDDFEGVTEDAPLGRLANMILLYLLRGSDTMLRLRSGGGPVESRIEAGAWETMMEPPASVAEPLAKRFVEMAGAPNLWPGPCEAFLTLVLGPERSEGFHVFLRPRRSGDVRVVIHRAPLRPEVQVSVSMKSEAVQRASEMFLASPSDESDAVLREAMEHAAQQGSVGVASLLDGIWIRVQHFAEGGRWSEAAQALSEVESVVLSHWGEGPEVTQLRAARGQMELEAGRRAQARTLFESALAGARQTFAFHPLAADLLDSLADIAELDGRAHEAIGLRSEAADVLVELDPEDAGIDAFRR